jgi:hypothetical protein
MVGLTITAAPSLADDACDQFFDAHHHVQAEPLFVISFYLGGGRRASNPSRKRNCMAGVLSAGAAEPKAFAERALSGAAKFWFVTALVGQWLFFTYIALFYGTSTASGKLEVWNRLKALGRTPYVPGDDAGNAAYAAHALGAGFIAFGGALQLIPWIRDRAPVFHHWNGRLFLLTVTALSLSGFYLVWIRGSSPTLTDAVSTTFNGMLILTFAFMTLKYALKRDFDTHPRWAMRLYLVSNAQWFLRVGLFSYFVLSMAVGHKPKFGEPFLIFWIPGCYLVPLAVLEMYLAARDGRSGLAKLAMALLLVALTLAMAAGILAFSGFSYLLVSGGPLKLPGS